jgi:hypothetical protein
MSKQVYYNLDPLDKLGATINILYGERSNGKSYQLKHKKGIYPYLRGATSYRRDYLKKDDIIEDNIKAGTRFILLRRNKEEISSEKVLDYLKDIDIMELTNDKYNCFDIYRKGIYLAVYDNETGKTKRYDKIGYIMALSTEQNYAGANYSDVHDIIFEEFMSRSTYLSSETSKLMNLYSTVDRKKGTTRLWLCGNTISRVCPYLEDWGLMDLMRGMKQGDIRTKWVDTGDEDDEGNKIEVLLALEWCKHSGRSSFIIGKHASMLNKGDWQSDPQPHLSYSYKEYKMLFRIGFQYQSFKFLGEYLMDKDSNTLWFIYPYNREFKKNLIVFSDIIKESNYWQKDIYNPTFKNDNIRNILSTFKESKIFYATDLVGTDFKQAIDFIIRK